MIFFVLKGSENPFVYQVQYPSCSKLLTLKIGLDCFGDVSVSVPSQKYHTNTKNFSNFLCLTDIFNRE